VSLTLQVRRPCRRALPRARGDRALGRRSAWRECRRSGRGRSSGSEPAPSSWSGRTT